MRITCLALLSGLPSVVVVLLHESEFFLWGLRMYFVGNNESKYFKVY